MAAKIFAESTVEEAALDWLRDLGYAVLPGAAVSPDDPAAERTTYADAVLGRRLRAALDRLNPSLPDEARADAYRKVVTRSAPSLVLDNRAFHRLLIAGVPVEYAVEGRVVGAQARLIDFDDSGANDWLAVNQFTVVEGRANRRPDVVVFVNGLPLAIFELKDASDPQATIWTAFNDHQTKMRDVPGLYAYDELLVISDGIEARVGALTSDRERFLPWRTIEGEALAPFTVPQLQVLIQGLFEKRRLLDLVRHFVVFEDDRGKLAKKVAAYHQFHAVNRALAETVRAVRAPGDHRVGVVWHTQGSGKSLTMVFYAGRLVLDPALANPTIVLLTDRNDLDDQLFGTFSRCAELLNQTPVQATDRAHLRALLRVASGGVVFTTIQKFLPDEKGDRHPLLTERRNVVVIADEAHRSQYDFIDGLARHLRDALPNAAFIGFTGTPIEKADANTRAVFGDYISVYDIQRAVEDGATVPIYYESRLAKLDLDPRERPHLDADFEEVTEGEEEARRRGLMTRWSRLEAVVGSEKRLRLIARDLVDHFEKRLEVLDGKAMVVAMSRRICVELYREIVALRPAWHDDDDTKGQIKVVMTGSASDPLDWQPHIRSKAERDDLAERFKDPADPLRIVIVRDMWLTGFDVPCLHTMYVDKPMRGHGLMQAIARVNRVFRDKPGGLVVDYLGLGDQLRDALAAYTEGGGTGKATVDQNEAVALMQEKYEVVAALFHGFDYSGCLSGPATQRMRALPEALQYILVQDKGKERLLQGVAELSRAFALAVPRDEALAIRDDVGFFQAVRAALIKTTPVVGRTDEDLDHAVRQLVSKALAPEGVVDVFAAAGLSKPDISILSDGFLAEVRDLPQKNLAVEMLQRLLNDEIRVRSRKYLVQSRSFGDLLEATLRRYHNRAIEAAQVIEELIQLATEMREARGRGESLGLTDDEIAFYDALETNDSAVKVLGDETLRRIARELVETIRRNTTVDWTVRESVRARLRTLVKRILRRYGYPPDKQEKATQTVLQQAELLSQEWAPTA